MKGIILHGGQGTRLRPLTFTGPKQLIPVANKPISQYVLEDLREAGIKEVAIVLGSIFPEKVKEHFGNGSRFGVRITYVEQREPKGIAHAIGLCKRFIGNDRFVVYLGDNLIKSGIRRFVSEFDKDGAADAMILLTKVEQPERFGVAKFDRKGKLIGLVEKPKKPPSEFALTGIYFFGPRIFEMIALLKPSWRDEFEITEAIQMLMKDSGRVKHLFIDGWWKDTGRPEDVIEANRLVLEEMKPAILGRVEENASLQGKITIGRGSVVEKGAVVRGPTIIGENTRVESRVYIGPYSSIGNRCDIRRGELENLIIMDDTTVDLDERVVDSLIGPNCDLVSGSHYKPRGRRFVLGEASSVLL